MKHYEINAELSAALHGSAPCMWMGTEESFDVVVKAQQMVEEGLRLGTLKDSNGMPAIWEKRGSNAIINVSGSLIDGSAGYMRLFANVIGYDDIAEAAIAAYSDPEVKNVMVRVESPGGQATGVMDCGNLLTKLSGMKPSMAYSANQMCSGGYWLGSSVKGDMVAGPMAEIGSIGVVMVLTNVSKALEDAGIKKTVMRAGENKARINSIEEMTPEVKDALQADMNDVHEIFKAQVARGRPKLSASGLAEISKGDTFRGKRAKSVGLVDNVASFEQALKLLDNMNPPSNTPSNSKGAKMKTVLTAEQIAKIALGTPVSQLGLSDEEATEVQAALDANAADAKAKQDAEAARLAAEEAAKLEANKGAGDVDAKLTAANAQVDLLKSQLVSKDAELVTAKAELQNLQASTQSMKDTHDGLVALARKATARLAIPLGGSAASVEAMDAAALVAEHDRLDKVFLEKFPVGGVAQGAAAQPEVKQDDEQTRAFKARAAANAARLNGKQ